MISGPRMALAARAPACARAPGPDGPVFDPGADLRPGGDQPLFQLVPQRDAAWAGALFVGVDTRQ
jgi:hypothetical protein